MSRSVTRGLTALMLGGLTSLTMMAPAHAAPCPPGTYPPGQQCIPVKLTVTTVVGGHTFTITVSGFAPFAKVTFGLHSTLALLGTYTADANGVVTATLQVPAGFVAGAHTITASGTAPNGKPRVLSAPLLVKTQVSGSGAGVPVVGVGSGAGTGVGSGAGTGVGSGIGTGGATGTGSVGSGLPLTGFELGAASLLGAGLLGAGTIALASGRKRKSAFIKA